MQKARAMSTVNTKLRVFVCMAVMLVSMQALAQAGGAPRTRSRVIDDSTKQVYGPNTSRYFFEKDVFYNRFVTYPIDTVPRNFHRYNYVQRNNWLWQDLGNIGTAMRPLYYTSPEIIGRTSGANVYDIYWDEFAPRYYDTKSSYTNMKVVLGGLGRNVTNAKYSRNIKPNWNFGIDYRSLLIDKNIQRKGKADRQSRDFGYGAYTTYQSKDSTYRIFANIRRSFHRMGEFGGVKPNPGDTLTDEKLFLPNAQPWLTQAESNDLRIHAHIFHQYNLGKALQAYHIFDRYRQKTKYIDLRTDANDPFYDNYFPVDKDSVRDAQKFKTVRNEVGLKGSLGKLFYNGYYAIRHYSMSYRHFNEDYDSIGHLTYDSLHVPHKGNEYYMGGRMSLFLDSIGQVNGHVEFGHEGSQYKYYKINGELVSRWFEARITQTAYAAGFIQQAYRGGFDLWNNDFSNIQSTQFNGYLHYRSSTVNVSPGLTFTRLANYVFFKDTTDLDSTQHVVPIQSGGQQIFFSPEIRASITFFRHITLSGQAIYTKFIDNADSAITVPKLFINTQLSYANIFFNGNFDMHGGVDIHWQSAYNAMGYDPAIRQFYIQNDVKVPAVPIIDLFLNARIKRGRVFFKYHNIVQAFTKQGYIPTPFYPGQPNTFEFGFDWSFYD